MIISLHVHTLSCMPPCRAIVVIGSTGSGKSRLAVDLARSLSEQCEVVSADSKQIFRGLDVGSAKTTAREQCGVVHHLVDCRPAHSTYSVGEFRRDACAAVRVRATR